MDSALLDTDILSEVIKQRDGRVRQHAIDYLAVHGQFAFSAFSRFEMERGFKEKRAVQQLARFAIFCSHSLVLAVSDEVLERAGDLWAIARQNGMPHGDADLIIAATALMAQRVLVTGNTSHFAWVPQLSVVNWRTL